MDCNNCECCHDSTLKFCDGCDEMLCQLCWNEHNEDWPDHTEHVLVMIDRQMGSVSIQADLDWHRTTSTPTPDYSIID